MLTLSFRDMKLIFIKFTSAALVTDPNMSLNETSNTN